MSAKEPKFRIVDIDKLPVRLSRKTEQWVNLLRSIPKGKALISTEAELGVKSSTLVSIISDYTGKNLIPKGYRVSRRTTSNGVDVYILHEGEGKDKEA
jgi:hypothetical protein